MKTTTRSTAKGQKRKRAAADTPAAEVAQGAIAEAVAPAEQPVQSVEDAAGDTAQASATAEARGATNGTVTLAANCSIKEVAALRETLCAVLEAQQPVSIDASAVERIDTATLQLLYAFVRDRLATDREVVWQGVTGPLCDAASLLGVRELLCLPARAELAA